MSRKICKLLELTIIYNIRISGISTISKERDCSAKREYSSTLDILNEKKKFELL